MSPISHPLAVQLHDAVVHNPHLNHHRMNIKHDSGNVTIHGSVLSFFEKQMAQEALRKIDGVVSIENKLEVSWRRFE